MANSSSSHALRAFVSVLDPGSRDDLLRAAATTGDPATLLGLVTLHGDDAEVLRAVAGNPAAKPGAREWAAELLDALDAGHAGGQS